MFKKTALYASLIFIGAAIQVFATSEPTPSKEPHLRIRDLLPPFWIQFPLIDPAIPPEYVMGESEITTQVLWGTKEDVKTFTVNPFALRSELIAFHVSYDVTQIGPETFSNEEHLERHFQKMKLRRIKIEKFKWGDYPVLTVEGVRPDGIPVRLGWIGANTAGGTTIVMVHYMPKNGNFPCTVWKNFLQNTKPLEGYERFLASGMDIQEGYTTYKVASASVKSVVERRKRDGLLATMVEPQTPNTTFTIDVVEETPMPTEWRKDEPCALVIGTMVEKEGEYGDCIAKSVIFVIIKEVEEFSFDLDPLNHPKGVVIERIEVISEENP